MSIRRIFVRLVCALAAGAMLAPAGVAHAGTYVIHSCNVPGQPAAPATAWTWAELTPGMYPNDECASGSGFGINAGPLGRSTGGAVGLEVPVPGLAIQQVRLWMVARLSGSGSGLFITLFADGASGLWYNHIFGPPGGDTLRQPYVTPTFLPGTTRFRLWLACTGGTPDGCTPSSPSPLEVRGAEVTLYEDADPSSEIVGGALVSGGAQSGVRTLDYAAADAASGVAQVTAQLGNNVVAIVNGSDCGYADFAACPRNRSGSLQVDTRKVPDGTYPLLLRVTDAAGNSAAIQAPTAVQIANGAASQFRTPASGGAVGDAVLAARFVGRTGRSTRVGRNTRVAIRGQLANKAGLPLADARIAVSETVNGARVAAVERTVVTGADGSFAYTSPRRGASRLLRFSYRPAAGGPIVASTRLRISVAASATLHVTLRGIVVTYSGRLLTRPVPSKGKLIQIEGRAAGGRWTAFAVKRTRRSGTFGGRYRLRVRRPGVRLQFRVRIPKQSGYPYEAATGHAVSRTVR